jgi:hypothetical protein
MANQLPLLENLTKSDIKELMDACVSFDAKNILGQDYEEVLSYGIPKLNLFWKTKIDFEKDIEFITGTKSIVEANKKLEGRWASGPEKTPEANRPTKEQLKTLEDEARAKEAKQKQTVSDAKKSVEAAIKKQQEINVSLQNKKIYAKVEISKEALPPDENTAKFIEEVKNHPASFEKDLAASIKAKISPTLSKALTEEEIDLLAAKTAYDTVSTINNFPAQSSANTQAAILGSLAKDAKTLPKIITDTNSIKLLKRASADLSFFENRTQLSKLVLSSVNENLATSVFGTGPENLKVSFFNQPVEGYTHEVDLGQLNNGYQNLLDSQSRVFDNISSFAGDRTRGLLTDRARSLLDSQILKLPADNAVSGIYNSEIGQQILSFVGLGEATPLSEGFLGGFIEQIPGGTAFLEGVGNFFGIDLIGAAAPAGITEATLLTAEGATGIAAAEGLAMGVETEAVTKLLTPVAGKVGASVLTKAATSVLGKGAMAAINTALQSLGSWIPIIGNAIALAAGWLINKIAEKINWKKLKEWGAAIIGGVAGLIALPFVGLGAALGIGIGTTAISVGLGGGLGGLTLGGIGNGIAGFFGALGRAFLGAIAMPILVILLVFPVIVALILFIINSGAYIVPPTTSTASQNPYINIEKVATPSGPFQNSDLPKTITYNVTVTAKTGTLTRVVITDDCKVIKKGGTTDCPAIAIPTPPDSISPSNPYSFDYTSTYDSSKYFDSLITNDINVTAVVENKQESATGGTSLIIGTPPTACFTFDNSWNPGDKAQVLAAIAQLSQATTYMATLCGAWGTIPLSYSGEPEPYAGFFTGNGILLYHYALAFGEHGTLYTLAHESGHAYAARVAGIYGLFASTPGLTEKICTYLPTYHPPSEDFAEMIGLYVAQTPNVNTGCMSNFKTQYANYWQFAHDHVFFQNLGW